MAPLPGQPTPNMPGTGASGPPQPPGIPNPAQQAPQGARVPTGLPYGQAQMLAQSQRSMPIAGHVAGPPGHPGPPAPNLQTGGAPLPPDHPDTLAAAQQWSPPIQPLTRKSSRPYEPITAGIGQGPGPGPEALSPPVSQPSINTNLSSLLAQIAQQSGSPAVADMAQKAAAVGQ